MVYSLHINFTAVNFVGKCRLQKMLNLNIFNRTALHSEQVIFFIHFAPINEQDVKKLEDMLSLKYVMPYEPLGNRKRAHKVLYFMTPILLFLSIGCYYIENYVMFWVGLVVTVLSLIWMIWYHFIGIKREKKFMV